MSNAGVTEEVSPGGQPPLKRVLGSKLLLFFVVGDIVGTGIYALTGQVAGRVGGALWLPFLLAFTVAFMTAFSYLELVGKYPRAAGAALYTHKAFNIRMLTFLVAFAVMCSGITSASSAAVAFGDTYLAEFVSSPMPLMAIAFIALLALINFRGVRESVVTNVVLTCIEIGGLLIIIGVGVWAVLNGSGDASRLTEFNTQDQTMLVAITSATSLAFFSMVGFEDSVNMAEETKDPARVFPKAMLWGMVVAATIYILVSVTSSLLVPAEGLEAAESGALLKVIDIGAPGMPREIFSAIGLFAVVNSALINMLMASRLVYGMANERIIPKVFGTVHPARRSPWVAILFTSAIAVVLVSAVDIDVLGGTTALLLLVVFAVVNVAVLVLRRDPVPHKHFRAPTVVPVLAAIFCLYLASPLSGRPARDYVVAAILLAVGLVLWAVNHVAMRTLATRRSAK
ncbi:MULTISPECIES: APC family permease [Prauserella salsuginis group]|uniref:Amino acid transporter n=2 Tax=Prauserella salsuginis group TaxID=2893672 RepID=A0A839XU21_9PSEU|nr:MULTISPECIES: APC family permease [Prauserella salsuginis group]MBB3663506.1 amino acid transporter [Prauserella sediminis]MCR3720674.1 Amino acid transporter [Prauserella flava]MCR3735245.1 Amino acid transporter [Prauserella salsuginis]